MAFAQGKFYLLFSFLFGYSLTLLLRRRTGDGLRRYRRRLVGLAVLGVLHAVFFFIADILLSYALPGIGLLFFVARSNRAALWGAAAAFTGGILLLVELVLSSRGTPQNGLVGTDPAVLDAALRGGFLDAAAGRIEVLPEVSSPSVCSTGSLRSPGSCSLGGGSLARSRARRSAGGRRRARPDQCC